MHQREASSSRPSSASKARNALLNLVDFARIVCLEIPLVFLIGCAAMTCGIHGFYYDYFVPYMLATKWTPEMAATENTYYRRICTIDDFSTQSLDDLVIGPQDSPRFAADSVMRHGNAIFESLVSTDKAAALREYILERNQKLSTKDVNFISLIGQKKRWSFKLGRDDHHSVEPVLQEIVSNPQFKETMEEIMGPNPALVEVTTITAAYGATDQHFHKDNSCDMTGEHYARSFAHMYSIFVPLQDTTAAMGATDACPGFHICHDDHELCDKKTATRLADDERVWRTGDAWLFHMGTNHRGPAHTDRKGDHRVVLIISIASRPGLLEHDNRILTLGTSYSLKMDMHGLAMRDFQKDNAFANTPPSSWKRRFIKTLRYLGIYKPGSQSWGWTYIAVAAQRMAEEGFGFREGDLKKHLGRIKIGVMPSFGKDTWLEQIANGSVNRIFGGAMPEIQGSDNRTFELGDKVEAYIDEIWLDGTIQNRTMDRRKAFIYSVQVGTENRTVPMIRSSRICPPGECTGKTHWGIYVDNCGERLWRLLEEQLQKIATIYTSVFLLTLVLAPSLRSWWYHSARSLGRVSLGSAPLLGLVAVGVFQLHHSQWGVDIQAGKVAQRPFLDPNIPSVWQTSKSMGPTIFPDRVDALIPVRMGTPALAGTNRFLEVLHPGNILWKNEIQKRAAWYRQYQKLTSSHIFGVQNVFQIHLISEIQDRVHLNEGLMLLQNHKGDWIYLHDDEARKYTRRSLLEESNEFTNTLGITVRAQFSELRHGRNRFTAMSRLHTPILVAKLEQIVYDEESAKTQDPLFKPYQSPKLFPLNYQLPAMPAHTPFKPGARSWIPKSKVAVGRHAYQTDDTVVALDRRTNEWFEGIVQHAYANGDAYDIKSVEDGRVIKYIPELLLRSIMPAMFVEGTMVSVDSGLRKSVYVTALGEFIVRKID